jgi:FdhD protein
MSRAIQDVDVLKSDGSRFIRGRDVAAVEEPLEIRLHGAPFVVIMRTPGADRELTAGFLLSERVIAAAADIGTIEMATHPATPSQANTVDVTLAGNAAGRVNELLAQRRAVHVNSSCGACGQRSIDDLMRQTETIGSSLRIGAETVRRLPDVLRASQRIFAETGGLHAAALFDADGTLVRTAEDVGRHNAVDKVVGAELLAGRLPLSSNVLCVSGRTSFEIVQKAVVAGVPVVAAVSAPSSLAVDLAQAAGVTLIGFVRGATFNVYAHPERVIEADRA